MLVGLLSDTHDRFEAAAMAVKMLRANGAEYLLHAGDVGSQRIIDLLTGGPAAFVWGNNDWDRPSLARYAANIGVTCFDVFGEVELDGKRFAITHGDDTQTVNAVLRGQNHDYLITGHSHVPHDRREGKVRWINPGALSRASVKTVALLNTQTDLLETLQVRAK